MRSSDTSAGSESRLASTRLATTDGKCSAGRRRSRMITSKRKVSGMLDAISEPDGFLAFFCEQTADMLQGPGQKGQKHYGGGSNPSSKTRYGTSSPFRVDKSSSMMRTTGIARQGRSAWTSSRRRACMLSSLSRSATRRISSRRTSAPSSFPPLTYVLPSTAQCRTGPLTTLSMPVGTRTRRSRITGPGSGSRRRCISRSRLQKGLTSRS